MKMQTARLLSRLTPMFAGFSRRPARNYRAKFPQTSDVKNGFSFRKIRVENPPALLRLRRSILVVLEYVFIVSMNPPFPRFEKYSRIFCKQKKRANFPSPASFTISIAG
jgi:hypothetical protein